jgi:chromosomal replication initiation ATPase DnaA
MSKLVKPRGPAVDAILNAAAKQIEAILNEPVLVEVYEPPFTLETIMAVICYQLQVEEVDVKGESRKEHIKDARHIACYLAINTGCYSTVAIGKWLNYDDHTPVVHACKRIKDMLDTADSKIAAKLSRCKSALYNQITKNKPSCTS